MRDVEAAAQPWPALGVLLLRDGLVTKDELESLLDEQVDGRQQRITSRRLGELLVDRGMVTETQVAQLVAEQYELPFVDLHVADVDLAAAQLLEESLARRLSAVAVGTRPDGCYLVAIADPSAVLFSDELRRSLGGQPTFVVVGQAAIDRALDHVYLEHAASDPRREAAHEEEPAGIVVELPTASLSAVAQHDAHRWPPLGALLVREGLVSEADLEAALAQQRLSSSMRLGEILVDRGTVTTADVARLVAEQYELPFVELDPTGVDTEIARLLPEKIARRRSALPLERLPGGSLRVVVADPTNVFQSDELRSALGAPLTFCVSSPEAIEEAIDVAHRMPALEAAVEEADEPAHRETWHEPDEPDESLRGGLDNVTVPDDLLVGDRLDEAAAAWLEEPELEPSLSEPAEDLHRPDAFAEEPPRLEPLEDEPLEEQVAAAPEDVLEHDEFAPEEASEAGELELHEELLAELGQAVAVAAVADEEPGDDEHEHEQTAADARPDVLEDALHHALSLGATTIQLTPRPDGLAVRARIDGAMQAVETLPRAAGASVARLAERAGLDPSARGPRHGSLSFAHDERTLVLGLSALPTMLGTQLILRVPGETSRESLSDLGLPASTESGIRATLSEATGVLLVCGPALSGQTTTLYAALHALGGAERALASVEGSVERLVPDVEQIEVDPSSGVTFPVALRAALRSDADVVVVDEIGDEKTAQVAFRAARTEALVLASLEAPTTSAAIARLTGELDLEPELAAATLSCVVAQQLVRRICLDCRETYYASVDELAALGRPEDESGRRLLARGRGCPSCKGTGFSGVAAVFEALPLTDEVRALVDRGAPADAVREAAVAAGMTILRERAAELCLDGVTTVAEVRLVPRG